MSLLEDIKVDIHSVFNNTFFLWSILFASLALYVNHSHAERIEQIYPVLAVRKDVVATALHIAFATGTDTDTDTGGILQVSDTKYCYCNLCSFCEVNVDGEDQLAF